MSLSNKTATKSKKKQTVVKKNDTITQYFSKTKKTELVIEEKEVEERLKLADQFYQNSLVEQRSKTICDKQKCIDLKSELQAKLKDMEKKCRQHENAINMCATIIAEKDQEILDLRQLIGETSVGTSDSTQSSTVLSTEPKVSKFS